MNARLPILALAVLATAPANAAEFYVQRYGGAIAFFLDAARPTIQSSLNLNGQFDTIDFKFTTAAGVTLTNVAGIGTGRPPGEPFTWRNRVLDDDPLDGGLGWSIVGQTLNANGMTFAGGPLGQTIDTSGQPDGRLFLANMAFSPANAASPGTATLLLVRAGNIVADLVPTPEPAAGVLGLFTALVIRAAHGRVNRSSRAALQ